MGRGDEEPCDEILVTCLHPRAALAAAPLRAIGRERHPLDIAKMRDGDDHVLALDKILVVDARRIVENDRPARRRMGGLDRDHLILDDRKEPGARTQNVEIIGDLDAELVQRFGDFVAAERGQALQPQFKDRPRLRFGQAAGAILAQHMARIGDESDQRRHVTRGPRALHQGRAGGPPHPARSGSDG